MTDRSVADDDITLRDSANPDAFARLRVSQPANIFDSGPLSVVVTGIGGAASVASVTRTEVR